LRTSTFRGDDPLGAVVWAKRGRLARTAIPTTDKNNFRHVAIFATL